MNSNGSTTKGLAELNHHMRHEQKEVRDGVTGDGQGLSEEDESRMNETHLALPRQQQQPQGPQGPVVRWERFLPLRSLKVLLVENDDSTRHVVSALLRNCSYEVMAVENGLEAWKAIEDLTNHIDLVLTEVVMPCLSGLGLLYKIMNHKTLKNTPVIMMSSNDSMGIVFKCLSKGAVDFLVKPIRKNELKNLWQHVWRRCHSSSGSGSESGIRTQKSTKLGSDEGSDNNTGSNDEDDDGSVGLNIRGGSDNGSGTQSSWTKRAVEVDSPKPISPWEQSENPPDSTCVQVIHFKPKDFNHNWMAATATRECQEQDDELENSAIGKDLEIGVPGNPDLQLEDPTKEVLTNIAGTSKDKFTDLASEKDAEELEKEKAELKSETTNGASRKEVVNLIDAITNRAKAQMESVAIEFPKDLSKVTNIKDKGIYGSKEIPSLELSLKRSRDVGDIGTSLRERNVLRHSGLSAFSRYNTTSTANHAPTGNVGSCSPADNSLEAAKMSNSSGTPNQRSNGSGNNNDMGSTTNNTFNQPEDLANNKAMPKSSVNLHPSSAFQPVKNGHVSSLQPVIPSKPDASRVNTVLEGENVQVQHHHHHYHHHHHHVHNMQKKHQMTNHDNCGPSNGLSTKNEANAAMSSASGSNNGSNGQNGNSGQNGTSAAVTTAEAANLASDNGAAGKCGGGGGSGSGSGSRSGVDQNRFEQREAALDKFRQKRKERCFEKKVRYQSRKKLAEQRPRVRGQFVRKVVHDNKSDGANS